MLRFRGTIVLEPGFDLKTFVKQIRQNTTSPIGLKRGENRIAVYAPATRSNERIVYDPASAPTPKDTFHFVYCESNQGKPVIETPPAMFKKVLNWINKGGFSYSRTDPDTNKDIWKHEETSLWGAPQLVSSGGTDHVSPDRIVADNLPVTDTRRPYEAALISPPAIEENSDAQALEFLKERLDSMLEAIRDRRPYQRGNLPNRSFNPIAALPTFASS